MRISPIRLAAMLVACAIAAGCEPSGPAKGQEVEVPIRMTVLSNRADLVSGGDALVEIEGVAADDYQVEADGRDVTDAFAVRADGRILGVVRGLELGENVLVARSGTRSGRLTITNHPIGGPVLSGPQIEPWRCTTEAAGLGAPVDAQCNAETRYAFYYRPLDGSGFRWFDPAQPPEDIATVTTDQGRTVPYVVRVETGTQNRGIYRVAVLFDPASGWEPWAPQGAWNGKLHYLFGGGCGALHQQGGPMDVLFDLALSRGFMVATSSLNVLGSNCNTTTSAEAVMMLKEHIVETYGEIRYTMAEGLSGGSMGQHLIANNYPGLLQGIQPGASYEDLWSTHFEVADCGLLMGYFAEAPTGLWADDAQRTAVAGHADLGVCQAWTTYFFEYLLKPEGGCSVDASQQYDPVANPRGCRKTIQDFNVATLGRRPPEAWNGSGSEQTRTAEAIAGGFARLPYGNAGIQYGLQALRAGAISGEQFVDLNESIGGVDIDGRRVPARRRADPGSELLYTAGGINDGARLDDVAIIDLRPTLNYGDIHTDFHSYAMRARLVQANGHHENQVIWSSNLSHFFGTVRGRSFAALDRWLAAVEADASADPLEVKVVRNKPADAVDTCFIEDRVVTDPAECAAAYPYFGSPRLAAGMPLTNDFVSCELKPLDRADYGIVHFTDAQWQRLEAAFPEGVCDYTQPAPGRAPSQPWLTYMDGPGGHPLPPSP